MTFREQTSRASRFCVRMTNQPAFLGFFPQLYAHSYISSSYCRRRLCKLVLAAEVPLPLSQGSTLSHAASRQGRSFLEQRGPALDIDQGSFGIDGKLCSSSSCRGDISRPRALNSVRMWAKFFRLLVNPSIPPLGCVVALASRASRSAFRRSRFLANSSAAFAFSAVATLAAASRRSLRACFCSFESGGRRSNLSGAFISFSLSTGWPIRRAFARARPKAGHIALPASPITWPRPRAPKGSRRIEARRPPIAPWPVEAASWDASAPGGKMPSRPAGPTGLNDGAWYTGRW